MLKRLFRIAVILIGLAIIFFAGEIIGEIRGHYRERMSRFSQEESLIRPFLSSSPAYKEIEIVPDSGDGSATLCGTVEEPKDLDRLRSEVSRLFGEAAIHNRMGVYAGRDGVIPPMGEPAGPPAPREP